MKTDRLTQKGLVERLIRLETKLDLMAEENRDTRHQLRSFVYVIIFIESINVVLNLLLYVK